MVEQFRIGIHNILQLYFVILDQTNSANPEDLFITTVDLIYSWEQTWSRQKYFQPRRAENMWKYFSKTNSPLKIMKDYPPVNILIFICIDSPDIFNQNWTFPKLPSNILMFLFSKNLNKGIFYGFSIVSINFIL